MPTPRLFTVPFRCKIRHLKCFKRMKQLFQAHETVALKREVPVTRLAPIELHELVIEFGVVEYR